MKDSAVQADKQNNLKTAAESKVKIHVYCQLSEDIARLRKKVNVKYICV